MRTVTLLALALTVTAPLFARLAIVEIHYNAIGSGADELALEFVEIYNDAVLPVEVSGYRFDRGIRYTFPVDTWIDAGGVVVVAADPGRIAVENGDALVFGPFVGRLDNAGEEIRLVDSAGSIVSLAARVSRGALRRAIVSRALLLIEAARRNWWRNESLWLRLSLLKTWSVTMVEACGLPIHGTETFSGSSRSGRGRGPAPATPSRSGSRWRGGRGRRAPSRGRRRRGGRSPSA